MRKMFLISMFFAAILACKAPAVEPLPSEDPSQEPSAEPSTEPSAEPSEDASEEPKVLVLAAPGNLTLTEKGEGIVLTWEDNSVLEEGYLIEKKRTTGYEKFFLDPDSESWEDENVSVGTWTYEVKSYKGLQRGETASVTYKKVGKAQAGISVQTSHYMASARVEVTADGGSSCKAGICWGDSSSPTVEDGCYEYPKNVRTGASFYANVRGLEQGRQYYIRAWAKAGEKVEYSEAVPVTLPSDPSPLEVQWTEIADYGFPSSVKLYKSTTSVTGRSVNMWYAVADLSAGDLEIRTTCNQSSLKTITSFVNSSLSDGNVYVAINGGYFATPGSSYSYIVDRGVKKANNISSINRTDSYNITRGVFALDSEGKPFMGWLYSGAETWAFEEPLPTFDGGPVIRPTAEYPCPIVSPWEPYAAMGGGPVLVKDGRFCFDYLKTSDGKYLSNCELFQTDIFAEGLRAPRTAVGYTPDGKVVLFVADGRNSGGSAGLTLDEEARIMTGLGCSDVLNLDGGGSTMMTAGNGPVLLNAPSDGHERAVYSYIAILGK